jgi:hypothetical protein
MADEEIFTGATVRDRFVAAATQQNESAAQRLAGLLDGDEDLNVQREDAWSLITAGSRWAALALDSAGVSGTKTMPIRDSEGAFELGQYLEGQLFALSQLPGFHDGEAGLVDAVKRAAYAAAELGPIPGGRLAAFGRGPNVVHEVTAAPADLQEVGSDAGEALRRLEDLGLGNVVAEASQALTTRGS